MVNRAYQNAPDNIVGKMTIQALDDERKAAQNAPDQADASPFCMRDEIFMSRG